MPEFSIYSSVLFIHVVSALVLISTGIFAPRTLREIRAARTVAELRTWVEFERRSTKWNPLAAFVLLGTGVYLGSLGFWTMGWFWVAVAMWVVSTILAVGIVHRSVAALEVTDPAPGEAPVPEALDRARWSRAWPLANAAMLASDLAMFYVMFNKPELTASIASVVVAVAIAGGLALARQPQPERRAYLRRV